LISVLDFLEKIINYSQVVETNKIPHDRINFGSKVILFDLETKRNKEYIILGTHETNPGENIISNKSPLGTILLGKSIGDEIEFKINSNLYEYEVLDISAYKFD
jgi:transcription elongation factor GreA